MDEQVVKELEEIVGADNVSIAPADRITHSYDATQQRYLPDVVVYAGTTEEVSRIVTTGQPQEDPGLAARRRQRLYRRQPCRSGAASCWC